MAATAIHVRVQDLDFDVAAEIQNMRSQPTDVGALVSFIGYCRSEEGRLATLELEYYPGMAEAEISRLAAIAAARWPVLAAITVIHRHGKLLPGDQIVLVATASPHRSAAFQAAEFLMDYLKTKAPFWKKEHWRESPSESWVLPQTDDDEKQRRWSDPSL